MAVFEIEQNGKTFEVEAPDQAAALKALSGYKPEPRSAMGVLTGSDGGERYQTWPERAVRSVLSLPSRAMEAAASAPPGSRESVENMVPTATETALLASPVNPAMRAGDRMIPGVAKAMGEKKPVVPTTQELKAAGVKDLNAAAESGLEIAAPAVVNWSRGIQQKLYDDGGITEVSAPSTFALLKKFEDAPADAVASAKNLKSIREALGGVAQNFNPQAAKDQLAATRAIKALDEFIPAVDEASVLAGSPAATSKLLETGRGNYAAAQRSNDITGNLDRATTGILERAEGRAQAANSGRNIDNTIRQKTAAILEKPKEISGLNEAEIAALEAVRDGGAGRNAARYVGNLLGGGGGLGQAVTAGIGGAVGSSAGPLGAAVGIAAPLAAGAGAKSIANFLARKDLKGVDELLRKRSPLYEDRVANPETYVISPERRAALIRMLMQSELTQQ